MSALGEVIVGIAVIIGVVGAATQLYPGPLIVGPAVFIWGAVTGGPAGWTVAVVAVLSVAIATVAKYLVAGGHLQRAGVPGHAMLVGGVVGIVGMFVVPVVGLPLGFVLGIYLAEYARLRTRSGAWEASKAAIRATGSTILIELAGVTVAVGAWVVGLLVT